MLEYLLSCTGTQSVKIHQVYIHVHLSSVNYFPIWPLRWQDWVQFASTSASTLPVSNLLLTGQDATEDSAETQLASEG